MSLNDFLGQTVRIQLAFDTGDGVVNGGFGVVIDDLAISAGCTSGCEADAECDDLLSCTQDLCIASQCSHDTDEACCDGDWACDDANGCTTDACVDDQCVFTPIEACCGDGACDEAEDCASCEANCCP